MKRQDLIFAFMPAYRGSETESLLLVQSIRRLAGNLRNHPVWALIPQKLETLSEPVLKELNDLGAELIPFDVDQKTLEFWFGAKVIASAAAESLAHGQADLLVWMDSDTLVLNEPTEFRLKAGKQLGGCPVMLKNISSLYEEPVNHFWELIYRGCQTPAENVFPLTTVVDEVPIRAQFNAGLAGRSPGEGNTAHLERQLSAIISGPAME